MLSCRLCDKKVVVTLNKGGTCKTMNEQQNRIHALKLYILEIH